MQIEMRNNKNEQNKCENLFPQSKKQFTFDFIALSHSKSITFEQSVLDSNVHVDCPQCHIFGYRS